MRLVTDADGKQHKLFFPEGKGFIKGWDLLIKTLCALGVRKELEEIKPLREAKAHRAEVNLRGVPPPDASYAEVTRNGDVNQFSAWVDVSDCMPRGDLGTLLFCLVGK